MSKNPKPRFTMSLDTELVDKIKAIPGTVYNESFSSRVEEGLRLFLAKYEEIDKSISIAPGSDKDFELHPEKKKLQQSFSQVKDIMKEVWSERKIKVKDHDD